MLLFYGWRGECIFSGHDFFADFTSAPIFDICRKESWGLLPSVTPGASNDPGLFYEKGKKCLKKHPFKIFNHKLFIFYFRKLHPHFAKRPLRIGNHQSKVLQSNQKCHCKCWQRGCFGMQSCPFRQIQGNL